MTQLEWLKRVKEHRTSITQYSSWRDSKGIPKAAVLVALQLVHSHIEVYLTVRSNQLSLHPGEVALPGGKAEADEPNPIITAFREAEEEIGLRPDQHEFLCLLTPILSRTGFVVHPVVSLITDEQFIPIVNQLEVQQVFRAPLEIFLSDVNYEQREAHWGDAPFIIHEFRWQGRLIWALTANILIHLATIIYDRMPTFLFDYGFYTHFNQITSKASKI